MNGSRRRASRSEVSEARVAACEVLRQVEERQAYAHLARLSGTNGTPLNRRDTAFATELVAGTLRARGRYDRIIELASRRGIAQIDVRTRQVLRVGVHQLLSLRTSAHAAVYESVELQRKVANPTAAGFVNGVLRAVGRASNDEWNARIQASSSSADEALATLASHPLWIVQALRAALAAEGRAAELGAALAADNVSPRVSLALLPGLGLDLVESLAETRHLGTVKRGPSPLGCELSGGDPARVVQRLGGRVRVQDQGSQLAALVLTRARDIRAGERWLDLCAGTGGKSALLVAEAIPAGARVRVNEVNRSRAERVFAQTPANLPVVPPGAVLPESGDAEAAVEVVCQDGRADAAFAAETEKLLVLRAIRAASNAASAPETVTMPETATTDSKMYDRILVDAPCSGIGALRRRADARWRKQPTQLPELVALQGKLLDAAAAHLKPGGLLAYVTCSPHLMETRDVVNGLLLRHAKLREIDVRALLHTISREPLDLAGDTLSAQLWPHRHGTDAMFIALLERVA